ncbi:MAG: hypothetical protein CMF96_09940 [Candidatus Marinimicrobia bacterium]|nr:hypothetical protein [Candidatus Neomarinimicrobiota bacterium]
MNNVYITSHGIFLPGNPIKNENIEKYLGMINGKPSRTRKKILKQNQIQTRYYAIDENQNTLYSNADLAIKAINRCINNSNILQNDINFLATATSQGDLPIPGFASMVHGKSKIGECEIASYQSVCAASMMAIKNAYHQVKINDKINAIACGSEIPSRLFKSSRYENQKRKLSLEEDFLRWMLSDGSGSILLQSKPSKTNISFKIEWIDIKSYAHNYETCMYAGTNNPNQSYSWLDYKNFEEAAIDGAINLRQNLKLVNNMVKVGVDHFFKLMDQGLLNTNEIDHLLCHYSSHSFKQPILDLLDKGGGLIPENKWFTNLYSKGNTGSASIFIMMEEFISKKIPKHGDKVLMMVPESGRFISSFMLCTVLYPKKITLSNISKEKISAPKLQIGNSKVQEWLVRQLTQIWIDYESKLNKIPIVRKINESTITLKEYRKLLLNLRQQVVDGAQWIARAASNVSVDFFESRSAFISHAREEHRDFRMLEKNYTACGGDIKKIQNTEKNIGSEALSAWMFHRASQPNPFDLLGAMFIIEGMGNNIAGNWGKKIKSHLNLENEQISFMTYHSSADENHFERLELALSSNLLTDEIAKSIAKTAKVTARLYCLQLEELDNI